MKEIKKMYLLTLNELAELVLKNKIFNFNDRTLKQKRGTAVGTKFDS